MLWRRRWIPYKKKTWNLVELPNGRKTIESHWVYKLKDSKDTIEKFKVGLVVKAYAQKLGINFDKIFSLAIHLTTSKVVLAIAVIIDLELE